MDGLQVKVYDEYGDEVQIVGWVNVDWDDDDEDQLFVSFYINKPEEYR